MKTEAGVRKVWTSTIMELTLGIDIQVRMHQHITRQVCPPEMAVVSFEEKASLYHRMSNVSALLVEATMGNNVFP